MQRMQADDQACSAGPPCVPRRAALGPPCSSDASETSRSQGSLPAGTSARSRGPARAPWDAKVMQTLPLEQGTPAKCWRSRNDGKAFP